MLVAAGRRGVKGVYKKIRSYGFLKIYFFTQPTITTPKKFCNVPKLRSSFCNHHTDGVARYFFSHLELFLTPMPRPGLKPTSVELHKTGTFRTLYRLSYKTVANSQEVCTNFQISIAMNIVSLFQLFRDHLRSQFRRSKFESRSSADLKIAPTSSFLRHRNPEARATTRELPPRAVPMEESRAYF